MSVVPLFSVVIPVYNRVGMISRAIQSVYAQDLRDWEIVVVDDGSTDDVGAVVEALGDPNVRIVRQANQGAAAARNLGVDVARGAYVAFLDSDDTFLPHHLWDVQAMIKAHGEVAVYSPIRVQRRTGYFIKPPRAILEGEAMADYLMCDRGFVQTSGLAVPTEAARRVRYRPDVGFGDDTDFAIRLQLAGYRFVMTARPGVDWNDEERSDRLSDVPKLDSPSLPWLDALRPDISEAAYRAYRGWHVAKGLVRRRPLTALALYVAAVRARSYPPRLALIVLAQILMPRKLYREMCDFAILLWSGGRRRVVGRGRQAVP